MFKQAQRVELVADDLVLSLDRGQRGIILQLGTNFHLVEIDDVKAEVRIPVGLLKPIHDFEN